MSWCHHGLDTITSALQHNRHPQDGAVHVWEQSNWWFLRYCYFCAPLFFIWRATKHLQQCLCLLHQHQCLLNLHLLVIKPLSMCHFPHVTGMQLTRCASSDCSSVSLILGSSFARSRLRNAWTTYSASWVRKVRQLWTVGSQLMKPTNEIWRNSMIILKASWMMRSPPRSEYMSLKMSWRGLMNQLTNS